MRTLILIVILALTTLAYSQKKPKNEPIPEHLKSFYEMRKKMLEEMNKSFADSGFDDPFFDQFFNEEDFINGFHEKFKDKFAMPNDLYQSHWEENDVERIFVLKPTNKETPLNIDIKNGMIQISAKSDRKDQNMSFTSSESLPPDVDQKKVKIEQRGNDILVRLPKIVGKTPNKSKINSGDSVKDEDKLKPLQASPGDVTI